MKKIGLTLGGGGAKGFAHIPILEVFDELGIKPHCITGTSIGSILGALYASGNSAKEIAEMVEQLIIAPQKTSFKDLFGTRDIFRFIQLIDPEISLKPKGILKGDKLLGFLYEQLQTDRFENLKIPFKAVATDFWRRKQVVFSSGDLLPAVRASMAIPYVFTPVIEEDRVLVDGGLVNNVPHDLLDPECDIKIAVDIMGNSSTPKNKVPSIIDATFHAYDVMMDAMAQEKLANHPVDIYLQPPILDIEMLDFHKAGTIYQQGLAAKEDFKRKLEHLLEGKSPLRNWFRRFA